MPRCVAGGQLDDDGSIPEHIVLVAARPPEGGRSLRGRGSGAQIRRPRGGATRKQGTDTSVVASSSRLNRNRAGSVLSVAQSKTYRRACSNCGFVAVIRGVCATA